MSGETALRCPAILASAVLAAAVTGCSALSPEPPLRSPPPPSLAASHYVSFDGDRFPYKKWTPNGEPDLVVIGFHGIDGASDDLRALGEHLRRRLPGSAVYAPDLRGQGNDPVASRRGDIERADDWFNDAYTFHDLVRERHPEARIVWFGESMGALIALHAAARAGDEAPCDALILSSPIPGIRADAPHWRLGLFGVGAALFPKARVTLEGLTGRDEVRVTSDAVHREQARSNPWHVPRFTLRLLKTLGHLVRSLPAQAPQVSKPVLLLHGGRDVFSKPSDVKAFAERFPDPRHVQRRFYPRSHHLLLYDHERGRVLADLTEWLRTVFD